MSSDLVFTTDILFTTEHEGPVAIFSGSVAPRPFPPILYLNQIYSPLSLLLLLLTLLLCLRPKPLATGLKEQDPAAALFLVHLVFPRLPGHLFTHVFTIVFRVHSVRSQAAQIRNELTGL